MLPYNAVCWMRLCAIFGLVFALQSPSLSHPPKKSCHAHYFVVRLVASCPNRFATYLCYSLVYLQQQYVQQIDDMKAANDTKVSALQAQLDKVLQQL